MKHERDGRSIRGRSQHTSGADFVTTKVGRTPGGRAYVIKKRTNPSGSTEVHTSVRTGQGTRVTKLSKYNSDGTYRGSKNILGQRAPQKRKYDSRFDYVGSEIKRGPTKPKKK